MKALCRGERRAESTDSFGAILVGGAETPCPNHKEFWPHCAGITHCREEIRTLSINNEQRDLKPCGARTLQLYSITRKVRSAKSLHEREPLFNGCCKGCRLYEGCKHG